MEIIIDKFRASSKFLTASLRTNLYLSDRQLVKWFDGRFREGMFEEHSKPETKRTREILTILADPTNQRRHL